MRTRYPEMLLDLATQFNDHDYPPLYVPITTIAFLHRLGKKCDSYDKPLAKFFLFNFKGIHSLTAEVSRIALPVGFDDLQNEIERLQLSKVDAIANQNFELAKALLDAQNLIKDRVRKQRHVAPIQVQPTQILRAISNLGFDQRLDE